MAAPAGNQKDAQRFGLLRAEGMLLTEDRRTVEVGTLTAEKIEAEPDGPCREINYDPSVLPAGMTTSDDGFPAARSSAYRVSFDKRTAEEKDYPHTAAGGGQQ